MRTMLLPVSTWCKEGAPELSMTITMDNTELHQTYTEHRRLLPCSLQSILEQNPMGPVVSLTLNCPFGKGSNNSALNKANRT